MEKKKQHHCGEHGIVELWLSQGSPPPVDTSPQFNLVQLRRELEKPQPLI